jgi:hypothetical protein
LVQEFLSHFKVKKALAAALVLAACAAMVVSRPFWNAGTMGSGLPASLGFFLILVQARLLRAERRHMSALYLLIGLLWAVHPLWGVAGVVAHAGVFGLRWDEWKKNWLALVLGLSPYLWIVLRAGRSFPSWGGDHPFFEALKDRNLLWDAHIQGDWSLWEALRSFGWGPIILLALTAILSVMVSLSGRRKSAGSVVDFWGWVAVGAVSVLLYSKRTDALGPAVPWFLACLARHLLLAVEHSSHEATAFVRSRLGTSLIAGSALTLAFALAWLPGQRYFRGHFYFPEEHALNLTGSLEGRSFLICDDPFEYYACLEARLMEPPSKSSAVLLKTDLDQRWYVSQSIERTPEILFSNITGPLDTIVKSLVLNNRDRWEIHWSRSSLPEGWNEPQAFPSVLTQVFQPQTSVVSDPARFQLHYDMTALPQDEGTLDPRTRAYLLRYPIGFNAMGNRLMAMERYSDAIHVYDRALRLDPSFVEPKATLERIYAQKNILEAAELDFERIIKVHPSEMARVTKGLAQAQKDRDEAASMGYLDQMIRLNAALADAQYQLSKIYEQRGRSDEARKLLRASVELDPQQADAQMAMGRYLAKTGNRLEAERAFRAVLIIEPQNKSAQIELWKLLNKP